MSVANLYDDWVYMEISWVIEGNVVNSEMKYSIAQKAGVFPLSFEPYLHLERSKYLFADMIARREGCQAPDYFIYSTHIMNGECRMQWAKKKNPGTPS